LKIFIEINQTKSYTLSDHKYKQKCIFSIHWITDVFGLYNSPDTSIIQW
jgi:hypothetical protein